MDVEELGGGEWLGRTVGAGVEELAGDAAAEEDGEQENDEEAESVVAAGSGRRRVGGGGWHGRSGARMEAGGNWETGVGRSGVAREGGEGRRSW